MADERCVAGAGEPRECEKQATVKQSYIGEEGDEAEDVLLRHIARQSTIVAQSLQDRWTAPVGPGEIGRAVERALFSPPTPPRRQENGTCEADPRINFYPTFVVPETLATYHIFFYNQKIPASCRANRTRADRALALKAGDTFPTYSPISEVPKIFEGLGTEEKISENVLEDDEGESILVELEGDNPRLAIMKRFSHLTHFAYPAVNLPPKVMEVVMNKLLVRRAQPAANVEDIDSEAGEPVVSDAELEKWLDFPLGATPERRAEIVAERRKDMMAVCLVTTLLECMDRFFRNPDIVRKMGETIHYAFRHGYVALASKISNVELSNLVSYMGILHENRLGQSVLHTILKGEAKRDYIRDTVFLMLVYTWQTAMGVWQQCLEPANLKELEKILQREKKKLWTGFDERTIAKDLSDIVMPVKLLETLQKGLPDLVSQSMMQNFRNLVLERSGILPAVSNAFPTDFVPITYKESPPQLWPYVYLMRLANYLMYHTDVAFDVAGEGLMSHYCRCNLCTPHRCLATNTALLNETQLIGTFEIQGPPSGEGEEQSKARGLKLTAGLWASAFLRKFIPEDYHAHKIAFYEDQSKPPAKVPTACVITQDSILGQLHEIKKAREEFLLKKGKGAYFDPQTGEELSAAPEASPVAVAHSFKGRRDGKSDRNDVGGGGVGSGERRRAQHRRGGGHGGGGAGRGSRGGRGPRWGRCSSCSPPPSIGRQGE
uniref:Shutoff protein n=1 Tax=Pipistrellus pipistrellus adenovirus TaxID=3140007 RepID=A0AAU6S541_9ADEN